jgi:hypothetical protein
VMVPMLLSVALLQGPPPTVRLICSLVAMDTPAHFEIRIENPSSAAVDTIVEAELVLKPTGRPNHHDPLLPSLSYRAALDLSTAVARPATRRTRLEIPSQSSKTWRFAALDLLWHKKVSATRSTDVGFRNIVPPGEYDLDLFVQREVTGWWVSRSLVVTVDSRGGLSVRDAEDN